jgi:hypothetical protein
MNTFDTQHRSKHTAAHATLQTADTARIVRSNALYAAIAAVLMLFYGFSGEWVAAAATLEVTLKMGGIAMALSTVLLLTGRPFALLYDGIATMVVGGGLALSGIRWCVDIQAVDFNAALKFVFAALFISSGRRSYRIYKAITHGDSSAAYEEDLEYLPRSDTRHDHTPPPPPDDSLGSHVLDNTRRRKPPQKSTQNPVSRPVDETPTTAETNDMAPSPAARPESSEPEEVPDGFLSSFADAEPDKRDD